MNFKKVLVLAFLSLGIFTGCVADDTDKVSKLEFKLDDGNVPEQYYSKVDMIMVPDYEKRTLTVDYSRVFPKRTAETVDEDVKITGVTVGGENFERFLKSVDYVTKLETDDGIERDENKSMFYVEAYVVGNGFPAAVSMNWDADGSTDENLESLKSFYLDVVTLLTENEPV